MDSKIKLIFLGTPDIAVKCLDALVQDGGFDVLAVVTQEDKPVGRKKILTPPAVKVYADKHNIPVYQPANINSDSGLFEGLSALKPDYNVVVAYGQIMSQKWLDMPRLRSVNLHVSLLPKYRGASPMQEALKNGDSVTGVCIQEMAFKMDTGDVLALEEFKIKPTDTFFEVYENAGSVGARLLVETLKADFDEIFDQGRLTGFQQDDSKASYCTKIIKKDGFIDFATMTATEIYNKYRAYKLWPGIWTMLEDKRFKLTEIVMTDEGVFDNESSRAVASGIVTMQNRLFAKCKSGVVEILRCQIEGKGEMAVSEYIKGM